MFNYKIFSLKGNGNNHINMALKKANILKHTNPFLPEYKMSDCILKTMFCSDFYYDLFSNALTFLHQRMSDEKI